MNADSPQSRRGTAFGDVNNDGNIDVVVFNVAGPPSLFLNETSNHNHRVLLRLSGTRSNRMAIGVRVTVTAGDTTQMDEVPAEAAICRAMTPASISGSEPVRLSATSKCAGPADSYNNFAT